MFSEFPGDGVVDATVVVSLVGGVVRIADEKAVHPVDDTEAGELELLVEKDAGEGYCFAGGFTQREHLGGSDLEAGVFVVCIRRVQCFGDRRLGSFDVDFGIDLDRSSCVRFFVMMLCSLLRAVGIDGSEGTQEVLDLDIQAGDAGAELGD